MGAKQSEAKKLPVVLVRAKRSDAKKLSIVLVRAKRSEAKNEDFLVSHLYLFSFLDPPPTYSFFLSLSQKTISSHQTTGQVHRVNGQPIDSLRSLVRLLDGLKVGDGDKTDEAGAKGGGGRRRGKAPAAATVVKTKERVAGGGDGPEATNQGGADAAIAAAGGGGRYCRFELDYDQLIVLDVAAARAANESILKQHSIAVDRSPDLLAGSSEEKEEDEEKEGKGKGEGKDKDKDKAAVVAAAAAAATAAAATAAASGGGSKNKKRGAGDKAGTAKEAPKKQKRAGEAAKAKAGGKEKKR